MNKNQEKYYESLNMRMRTIYNSIGSVFCGALNKKIIFNAQCIFDERDIKIRISRKKGCKKVNAKQYALVATVDKEKLIKRRVIILEIESSQHPIFWSIMRH
jgi:hypothetical protein